VEADGRPERTGGFDEPGEGAPETEYAGEVPEVLVEDGEARRAEDRRREAAGDAPESPVEETAEEYLLGDGREDAGRESARMKSERSSLGGGSRPAARIARLPRTAAAASAGRSNG